jgi:uncharacterized protein
MIDIESIKPKIVKALMPLKPEKIILFGSFAYGNPTEDSDLDVCIIEKSYENKWTEKKRAREALRSIRVAKDILVETEEYFLSHSNEDWINTALYDIKNKGVILYENK